MEVFERDLNRMKIRYIRVGKRRVDEIILILIELTMDNGSY